MRRKAGGSKVNAVLTASLVLFVCLLAFSVGVLSGKGWSDREHMVSTIQDSAKADQKMLEEHNENPALGEDLTDKEVEALTKKALEDARKNPSSASTQNADDFIAEMEAMDKAESQGSVAKAPQSSTQKVREAASVSTKKRARSSVAPKIPTLQAAKDVEYTVQVAAYKNQQEAESHSERLKAKGLPAFPVSAKVKGETWYRVSIGSFSSSRAAKQYNRKLRKDSSIKTSLIRKIRRQ